MSADRQRIDDGCALAAAQPGKVRLLNRSGQPRLTHGGEEKVRQFFVANAMQVDVVRRVVSGLGWSIYYGYVERGAKASGGGFAYRLDASISNSGKSMTLRLSVDDFVLAELGGAQ